MLIDHFENGFFCNAIPSFLKRDEELLSEPDLDLELSDIMEDDTDPRMFNFDEEQAAEIIMDERNSCCHRDNSDKDFDENESTFISHLPEPEQSHEMIPFEHTFESMDAEMNESLINSTKVLPLLYPRSRFISE